MNRLGRASAVSGWRKESNGWFLWVSPCGCCYWRVDLWLAEGTAAEGRSVLWALLLLTEASLSGVGGTAVSEREAFFCEVRVERGEAAGF